MTDIDQRQPRVRASDYMGWISRLPCVACMCVGKFDNRVHVMHLRAGSLEHGKRATGMAEKPSDKPWTLPGCPHHHLNGGREAQHDYPGGEVAFWNDKGICPFDLCLALERAYDEGRAGAPVIAEFAARARKAKDAAVATARVPLDPA